MPGTNSFYPYGESSTNILNNSEYQTDSERSSGAQSGAIARSKMYNKQARQAAAGAYAVGALVAKSGKNADDSSAATLAANFQGAVSYQAAHFVASAVSVSGTTATATVAELATTAAADLPALFALSLVLDQALPAGASIAIASSLPDVTLSWPIYVGSEALDSDTITGGAITLLIDTVGAKAFFKAGGGRYKPTDLPPLNPNFTMEISEGDSEDTVTVTADKLTISPTTDMLAGGQWEYGTEMSPAPGKGQNIKHWTREQLVTSGKPFDGLLLGDVTASDAANETILWLPENQNGETVLVPFIVLSTDYLGGVYVMRKYLSESIKATWGSSMYYPTSTLDSYIVNTYLNSILSKDIVDKLVMATVPVVPWQSSGQDDTMQRKAWSLSYGELYGGGVDNDPKMPYFEVGAPHRIAYVDGGSTKGIWWTRSINRSGGIQTGTPYSVDVNGAMSNDSGGGASNYVRPAFVLPKDFQIQQRPDGSYTVYNDYGLMTLKDIQASTSKNKVVVNVEEISGPSRYIYHTNNYNETKRALLEREDLPTLSTAITTAYVSGLATVVTQWCQSNLGSAVQSLVSDVSISVQTWNGSLIKSSIEQSYFLLSVSEYGTDIGTGTTLPYYSSSTSAPNKIKKYNGSAYKYWLRDLHSFTTASRWYQYRVDTDGAIDYDNGNTSYGYTPAFTLPLTAPIRLLADGTYDLVPEDPSLSAQTVSTLAEEQSGTTVTLADIPVSTAGSASLVKIKEEDGQEHDYLVLVKNYQDSGGTLLQRYNATSSYSTASSDYASESDQRRITTENWADTNLSQTVRDCMVPVSIPYRSSSGSASNYEADGAFLLSGTEVGGSVNPATGSVIAYFNSNTVRIKRTDANSAVYWWTRDFAGGSNNYIVTDSGSVDTAPGQQYIVPAFVLSNSTEFEVDESGVYHFLGMNTSPTVSFSFTVPHGTQPVVRQYTYNYEEHYQTMLEGGVLPALGDVEEPFALPEFTGNHTIFGDETSGRIELYESGTLTLYPGTYDFFLVGGGGGGSSATSESGTGGGGGGGGYTKTELQYTVRSNLKIMNVYVGSGGPAGGSGSATTVELNGSSEVLTALGATTTRSASAGNPGGSGGGGSGFVESASGSSTAHAGAGGYDGSDGSATQGTSRYSGGKGQGATTRLFGTPGATLYAGGGGGGGARRDTSSKHDEVNAGPGGEGGGGTGGSFKRQNTVAYISATPGSPNTGGGGGGGSWSHYLKKHYPAAAGGSGVVIIRWNNA